MGINEYFINKVCVLLKTNPNYKAPTPEDVSALIKLSGWSQSVTAKLAGVKYNHKGSMTVRRWQYPQENKNYRQIDYATWRLLLISAGVVDQKQALLDLGLDLDLDLDYKD